MKMKRVLIDKSWVDWDDADDILQYYKNEEIKILEVNEILKMTKKEFTSYIFFVNTDTVRFFLGEPIDTYDSRFTQFFNREIKVVKTDEIDTFPIFIKPMGNAKEFTGLVINNKTELDQLIELNEDILCNEVYSCNVVRVTNPHRLLIGNKKLYGMGKEYKSDPDCEIDFEFLSNVLELTNDFFVTIDIGIINGSWGIIELNPWYSIDSWEIDLNIYFTFCEEAIEHNRSR
jgi:hypothetical protein